MNSQYFPKYCFSFSFMISLEWIELEGSSRAYFEAQDLGYDNLDQ